MNTVVGGSNTGVVQLTQKAVFLIYWYCIKAIQELCEKEGMRYSKPIYKDPYTYLEKKTFIAKMPSQKYLESEPYEREPIILPKRRE